VCLSRRGNIAVSSVRGQGASFKFSWPTSELKSLSILEAGAA